MRKMHKFLKILILIIFVWAVVTLPSTLSYFSHVTNLQELESNFLLLKREHRPQPDENDVKITVGIVACGEGSVNQSIVLLKSVLLSSIYYGITSIDAILFADDEHLHTMDLKVESLKNTTKGIQFRYEIHPVIFPSRNHDEWRDLFKPCASQRLFLHSALPHINEILYLDVDTLVVGDLRNIFSRFKSMSTEQAVGLVPEAEIASIGWYNRFAKHPYFPPYGLNTGVMLMNLTRLRPREQSKFDWEQAILESFKIYKNKITFGDQDLINIVFYNRPDMVYLLPCPFNFRTDHCQYGFNCKSATMHDGNGIHILHGSRSAFFQERKFQLFSRLYNYFREFDMANDDYINNIVIPFKTYVKKSQLLRNAKSTPNCDNIGHLMFTFANYKTSV